MANEIYMQGTLTVNKGSLSNSKTGNITANMTGTHASYCAQGIPTTQTLLSIATDVATPGATWFRNTDATNYVQIGVVVSGTFYPVLTLNAGEFALCRLATNTIYAKANTATVVLEWLVNEA